MRRLLIRWLVGCFTIKPSKALVEELNRKYFIPQVVWDEAQQEYVASLGLFSATSGRGATEEEAIENMHAKLVEAIRTAPKGMAGCDISGSAGTAGGEGPMGPSMYELLQLQAEQDAGKIRSTFLSGVGKRSLSSMTDAERIEYSTANFNVHCGMGAKDHFAITKWFAERGFNVWGDK